MEATGGGQGSIQFLQSRMDPEKRAALKRLKRKSDLQQRGRMRLEVVALRTLSGLQAKVPSVLEDNTDDFQDVTQELYVVMEYVPGVDLARLVNERGPMLLDAAAGIVIELCKTVEVG